MEQRDNDRNNVVSPTWIQTQTHFYESPGKFDIRQSKCSGRVLQPASQQQQQLLHLNMMFTGVLDSYSSIDDRAAPAPGWVSNKSRGDVKKKCTQRPAGQLEANKDSPFSSL